MPAQRSLLRVVGADETEKLGAFVAVREFVRKALAEPAHEHTSGAADF